MVSEESEESEEEGAKMREQLCHSDLLNITKLLDDMNLNEDCKLFNFDRT